jgi:hypothetical protein
MARPRSTIGSNPLDAVVPMGRPEAAVEESSAPPSIPRERVTIALPADLMERARNAVYWTPGATLAGLVEDAVRVELAKREAESGGAFKARRSRLKPGRRVGD